jgi:hypothetical protein
MGRKRLLLEVGPSAHLPQVIETPQLPKDTLIKIVPEGMIGGLRHANDGISYFGTATDSTQSAAPSKLSVKTNDFILPNAEGCGASHFAIQYSPANDSYYINTAGGDRRTHVKLVRPTVCQIMY